MMKCQNAGMAEKKLSSPEKWKKINYKVNSPSNGVKLSGGIMKDIFLKNINYLNGGMSLKDCVDAPQPFWVDILAGSNEGRLLQGYANSIIWGENNEEYAKAVNEIIDKIRERQLKNNGYALPYEERAMSGYDDAALDERRNYDRAMFTRGLIAAGNYYAYIGVPTNENKAYIILRDFYDYFNYNENGYGLSMLEGFLGVQGHIGSTLTYFSPIGKTEDMSYAELCYVQNWWMDYIIKGIKEAVWKYPLNRPHCYLITAFEAYLDHYRATGDKKYLDTCLEFWKIMKENFIHEGGCMAICEFDVYEPSSFYISEAKHTGELCGSIFWIDFNYRLLQLFPDEEKYASEIERSITNVIAVAQDEGGKIIYHQNLNGHLRESARINSCCEVTSVGLIARLPSFIYQLSESGVKISLYNDSVLNTEFNGKKYHLKITGDIYSTDKYTVENLGDSTTLSLRIPSWIKDSPKIFVNGEILDKNIEKGKYFSLNVNSGDKVTLTLPKELKAVKYIGFEQVATYSRYSFTYGPLLMSIVPQGEYNTVSNNEENIISVGCNIDDFIKSIDINKESAGLKNEYRFIPYSRVGKNVFSAFPLFSES